MDRIPNTYISSVIPELQENLDKPLYIAFNHHATEDLSRIRMEDYTTENKLGIKRWVTVLGTEGMPKAFQDFTDMFAVDYNLLKDGLKTQDGKEVTLEDYLLSFKSVREFSRKMDNPVLEFISAALDITADKPLIECCTGCDMITGEDLSDFERGMKAVCGVVSLFTLGQGSFVMNGGKLALGETVKMGAKILAVDAVSTGVVYGTSEICQAMGAPRGLTLVLSMLAGMGSSTKMGSKVFGNGGLTPDDIAYQRHWNEGVSGAVESGSEIQTIHNRFPNEIQSGRRFNYSIDNEKIYLENGIQEVDFVIDMDGNLHLGRGHSFLANGKVYRQQGS